MGSHQMTMIIQDAQIAHVADLLRSFKVSVWDLRQSAERLRQDIEADAHTEIGSGSKELSQAKTLVAACQKLEMYLAELEAARTGDEGSPQFDFKAARAEIGERLARLRDERVAGSVS